MAMLTVRNLPDEACFPTPDGDSTAIAVSRGFIVASRDTAPYAAAGVTVINPFDA